MSAGGPVRAAIVGKLTEVCKPTSLNVVDESHKHLGHAGNPGGGETHFKVEIEAEVFRGMTPVKRHRLIYQALDHELKNGVHALSISAREPPAQQ